MAVNKVALQRSLDETGVLIFCPTSVKLLYLSNFSELSAMARTEKDFCSICARDNHEHTTHSTTPSSPWRCLLRHRLAISWCHNEANNKQHVRIERHVTARQWYAAWPQNFAISCRSLSRSTLLRTQHHRSALIDHPVDHTNVES